MKILAKSVIACASVILLSQSTCLFAKEKRQPLTGCATINWFEKGKADANAGLEFTKIDEYTADCKKENVTPPDKMYFAGYLKGLETFCTAERGYHLGSKGGASDRGCSNTTAYVDAFKKGQHDYKEKVEQDKIERLTRPRSGGGFGAEVETPSGPTGP